MGSAASAEPRALTSWRVLVAVVAAVILTVVAGTIAVRAEIRSRTVESTADAVAILNSIVIDQSLTYSDIARGMTPVNHADLNADVILLKRRGEINSLTIWSLDDGRLVYSDVDPADNVTPPPEVMARARQGQPFVDYRAANGEFAETVVYNPYDPNGDGTMDAVAEVVLPSGQVEESIAQSTGLLYLGGFIVLLLAVAGILQVRRHQIRQDHATVHDSLTGLGNRLLLRRISLPVLKSATAKSPVPLLLIDLDSFKAINDTFGHNAGDEVLVVVAARIRQASGPSSVPIRLGGDEFAVLLPHMSDVGQAREMADRIRNEIGRPLMVSGFEVEIDASVGIAWAPADGTELNYLMRNADMAMYWAKRSGDGVTEYAQVAEVVQPQPRATTLPQLSRALADHELELFYQPIRAANGVVVSVEALARWHHPELGLLDARMFIPTVAHMSLDSALTEWVLRQAARQCAQWRASGLDLNVSINVSARSLYSESLAALVRSVVDDCELPLSALELEVAETIVVSEPGPAIPAMWRLHNAGVGLCLDRFGAEYGAVSAVTEVPVRRLKIDRRYGGSVVEDPLARTMVAGWVRVAHQLGLTVTAQGAETPAAWRSLFDLGCDEAQGYGIGQPMPAAELTQWFTQLGAASLPGMVVEKLNGRLVPTPDGK